MKDRLTQYLDKWIFETWKPDATWLGCIRILFAAYFLLYAGNRMDWMASFPDAFFVPPPSIAALFPGFPGNWFFQILNVLQVITLLGILFGYYTRLNSIGFAVVMLLSTTFMHSFGKINHISLLFFFPIIMGLANWGTELSLDKYFRKKNYVIPAWSMTFLATIVGFMLFTSGWVKYTSGWLDTDTQAIHSKVYTCYYALGRTDLLAEYFLKFDQKWLWEIADWVVCIFELAFLPAIFFPRLFRISLGIAIGFHLLILLALNIDFSIHFSIYATFARPDRIRSFAGSIGKWLVKTWRSLLQKMHPAFLLLLLPALIWILYAHGSLYRWTIGGDELEKHYLIPIILWTTGGIFCLYSLIKAIARPKQKRSAEG